MPWSAECQIVGVAWALLAVGCGQTRNDHDVERGGAGGAEATGGAAGTAPSGGRGGESGGGGVAGASAETRASVMADRAQSCVRFGDGRIKCWGQNGGWLGLGDYEDRGDEPGEMGANLPFVDLGSGVLVESIGMGEDHTCAVLTDHTVKCWGQNSSGELGLGDTRVRGIGPGEMTDNLPPVALGTGRAARQVVGGMDHTCALLDDGRVKCWGNNGQDGILGLGDTVNRGTAPGQMGDVLPSVDLGVDARAKAITAGGTHTCALLEDGRVKCWGSNLNGELGLGDTAPRGAAPSDMGEALPAVELGTDRTAVSIAAGKSHTCAVLDNGWLRCWGWNAPGTLGVEDERDRGGQPGEMGDRLPDVHLGTGRVARVVAAGGYHNCALLDDDSVKCWGENDSGQLGVGDTLQHGSLPGGMGDALPAVRLGTGRHAVGITTGYNHSCAVLDDDSVKCWGRNDAGQLGLGDTVDRGGSPDQMDDGLPAVELR